MDFRSQIVCPNGFWDLHPDACVLGPLDFKVPQSRACHEGIGYRGECFSVEPLHPKSRQFFGV